MVNHHILLSTLLRKGISGTALQWFDSYLSDRSFKLSWERWGIQVATSSYRGATGLSSWTTSLFCLHGFTRFCHSETWLFISLLCWWHSTLPLIPSWWSNDSCSHLSMSIADISCWMKDHHHQLNLAKTELLVVSANPSIHHNFTFQFGSSTITPSKTARNLGVVIDDKLNFTDHITKTARYCRFALYNIILALVLSRLDYCNALLWQVFQTVPSNLYN